MDWSPNGLIIFKNLGDVFRFEIFFLYGHKTIYIYIRITV